MSIADMRQRCSDEYAEVWDQYNTRERGNAEMKAQREEARLVQTHLIEQEAMLVDVESTQTSLILTFDNDVSLVVTVGYNTELFVKELLVELKKRVITYEKLD